MIEKTLFFRKIDKKKMIEATTKTIDFLHDSLKLKIWEQYFVVKTLYESFPKEGLLIE